MSTHPSYDGSYIQYIKTRKFVTFTFHYQDLDHPENLQRYGQDERNSCGE